MSGRQRQRGDRRSGAQPRNKRRRQGGGKGSHATFWGDASKLPVTPPQVRITEDPSALVRSLGPPPLAGHETIAEHYFAAVYDRAVSLAGAVAAAGGLVEPEELPED